MCEKLIFLADKQMEMCLITNNKLGEDLANQLLK